MKLVASRLAEITLVDELNFKELSVHIDDELSINEFNMAMLASGWGYVESEQDCQLFIGALSTAVGAKHDPDTWLAEFDKMVSYADTKGWLSADQRYLQAHIVRV